MQSKPLFKAGIFAGVVTVCFVACSAVWLTLQPSAPQVSELDAVELSLPKAAPPSAALHRLLALDSTPPSDDKAINKLIEEKMGKGVVLSVPQSYQLAHRYGFPFYQARWLSQPDRALEQISRLKPSLADFRAALYAPGCTPRSFLISQILAVSHGYFMRGTTLELVRSLALLQSGDMGKSIRALDQLMDRLVELEQTCIHDAMWALTLSYQLNLVHAAYGFVLATPQAARYHRTTWRRLIKLEKRPIRMDSVWKHEAVGFERRLRKASEVTSFWSFNFARTITPIRLLFKRRVAIAKRLRPPLRKSLARIFARPFAEQAYVKRLEQLSLRSLRFNRFGLEAIMSFASAKRDTRYALKLYSDRCQLAATRARWMMQLKGRAVSSPAALTAPSPGRGRSLTARSLDSLPTPRDPFTSRTFHHPLRKGTCQAPGYFTDPIGTRPLPSYPITTQNSGKMTRPKSRPG